MTDAELVALAVEMRAAQRAYYKAKAFSDDKGFLLERARAKERAFDKAVAERGQTQRC